MKCDMHVHSYFSGRCTTRFLSRICRESYNHPDEVYERLRERGMTLFTLTDHDSIEGAETLLRRPNFFVSEEVTCHMPSGAEVHIGVFDITERKHLEIQRRRDDLPSLLAYFSENRVLFCVNHVFSSLTGRRAEEDFAWFRERFPAVEARNGHLLKKQNAAAARFARNSAKIALGGSDAHAMASAGATYTEVPGAQTKEEFFAGLHSRMGRACGESGSHWKLTRDVLMIVSELIREERWMVLFSPLAALVPIVTFANYAKERHFLRHWSTKVLGEPEIIRKDSWIRGLQGEAEEWTWP
jgi:predicted metal-dependent phosphoesterase TrpH